MPVTAADIAASDRIAAQEEKKAERNAAKLKGKRIAVYVCPTEGCPDYFGSGGMPVLEDAVVGQSTANFEPRPKAEWHSRASCPTCRASGKSVERIRVELFVPFEALTAASAA